MGYFPFILFSKRLFDFNIRKILNLKNVSTFLHIINVTTDILNDL